MSNEWSQASLSTHESEVRLWIEEQMSVLDGALDKVLKEPSTKAPQDSPRFNWRLLIMRRLHRDWATFEELLVLIENRKPKGGISARDILTGTLNQMDDDGLIFVNSGHYNLTKRGHGQMEGAA